jgi:hypothetical protein
MMARIAMPAKTTDSPAAVALYSELEAALVAAA